MPEKPEVITVARTLEKQVIGKTITDTVIYWDNIIAKRNSWSENFIYYY